MKTIPTTIFSILLWTYFGGQIVTAEPIKALTIIAPDSKFYFPVVSDAAAHKPIQVADSTGPLDNTRMDGYRGIWFELGQRFEYGDKYSGALGTYTAKHVPLAIYAPAVDKTFFVYGGTPADTSRHLLCMIGVYDHQSGKVSRPRVVCDKQGVIDPHDNPSIMIDREGFIWVFISGRGRTRPGFKYKSRTPYSIGHFDRITEEEMTYPQPWKTEGGYLHLFTKYTGVRQLYFERSSDGVNWTEDQLLAAIPQNAGEKSGHYQTSATWQDQKVGTFFNRHPQGNVDRRTDLYYIETTDMGQNWTSVAGDIIEIPLTTLDSPARIVDYYSQEKNIYLKDMGYTTEGFPVGLFVRSKGHEPGPGNDPYEWIVTRWDGDQWHTGVITESDHNYDMGSIYIEPDQWRVVAPTTSVPDTSQDWGVGGEVIIWESGDRGNSWSKMKEVTSGSTYNNSYIRRPVSYQSPFCFFWADGHPHHFSPSRLYFGDFDGHVWQLPSQMEEEWEPPVSIK